MDAPLSPRHRPRVAVVTPAQIVALGLVAASIGWAAWLLRDRPSSDEVALLEGTTLTASQLAAVEAALDRAKLADYRTADGTVWVPRTRQGAYNRAIVDADALPKPWGTRFHEAIQSGGVWTSTSARAESLKVALQDELSQVLCSMPGIERAAVLYDVEERAGFQQEPLKTASVGIGTSPGSELDAVRAHGIRILVASSIAGLDPERVAVTDLATGRVFAGPLDDPAANAAIAPELARRFAHESALAGRVRQALAFVRGVIVDVAIDPTPIPSASLPPLPVVDESSDAPPQAAANAPAELLPPAPPPSRKPVAPGHPTDTGPIAAIGPEGPGVVHVTVSIPDSYLAAAIEASKGRMRRAFPDDDATGAADAEVERLEIDRLRDIVGRSLPAIGSPERLRILVTSYPTSIPAATELRAEDVVGTQASSADHGPADEITNRAGVDGPTAHAHVPDMPREAWLAATSIFVGLLAGFLWWAGSRAGAQGEESTLGWNAAADRDRSGSTDERRLAA